MTALASGRLDVIAPGVRRLVAFNPGFMTGPGTNTYLLGTQRCVVIDPGPAEDRHVRGILEAAAGRIDAVLVTHTHPDHSPGAQVLAARTGAAVLGRPAPDDGRQDEHFSPTRVVQDGDEIDSEAGRLRALHTPGHASNHVCYLLDTGLLFTGDHLMQGSTVVIAPPDGHMGDYLRSLRRLQGEAASRIAPGHGSVIEDAPAEIARIIEHRLQREAKVMARLTDLGTADLGALVGRVYDDVDARLHPLAKSSLLAHLIKLQDDGRVHREPGGERWTALPRA